MRSCNIAGKYWYFSPCVSQAEHKVCWGIFKVVISIDINALLLATGVTKGDVMVLKIFN